jgi:hypothetical protein
LNPAAIANRASWPLIIPLPMKPIACMSDSSYKEASYIPLARSENRGTMQITIACSAAKER